MRILLFGRDGQLGWELAGSLNRLGELVSSDKDSFNLANTDQISDYLRSIQPDVIVNAAAYTDVDRAEREEDLANAVNAIAPGIMAEEARKLNAILVHYSTDYVFDGTKCMSYTETDTPNPVNAYGRSKLAGEVAICGVGGLHFILRTSWLYSMRQESFPTKVLAWAREQKVIRIVDDQVGCPTWCRMLADVSNVLLEKISSLPLTQLELYSGIYHVAGNGHVSRYEWGKRILGLDPDLENQIVEEIQSAKSEDFPTLASRPSYSALDCSLFEGTFDVQLPGWEDSLKRAMLEGFHDG
jgi:dTDP-4-dehydrorhamnose reductase